MRIHSAVCCYTVQWWGYSQWYVVTLFSDDTFVMHWWGYSQQYVVSQFSDDDTVNSKLLHSSVMRIQSAVCCYTVQWWGYGQQYIVTQFIDEDTVSSMLLHSSLMRIWSAVHCYTVYWWGYSQQYVVTQFSDEDTVSSTLLCSVQNFQFLEIVPLMEKWYFIWSNHTLNKIICIMTEFFNVFWDVTSCSLVRRWQCFVATYYPHIQVHLVTPSISQSSILAWRLGQQCGLLKHWYLCRSLHSVVIPDGCGCSKLQHETLCCQTIFCLWKKKLCIKWNSGVNTLRTGDVDLRF